MTASGAVSPARGSSRARTRSSDARPASRRFAVYADPDASPRAMKRLGSRGERNETLAGAARVASEAHVHALSAHPLRRGWRRRVARLDTHRERRVASRDASSALTNVGTKENEHRRLAPLCREFVTRFFCFGTVGTLPDLGRFLAATHGARRLRLGPSRSPRCPCPPCSRCTRCRCRRS